MVTERTRRTQPSASRTLCRRTAQTLGMMMSMVASTRGVALLPAYAENFLPWAVTSRPLTGDPPTIELLLGYNKKNESAVLKLFLARSDELVTRFREKSQRR